MLKNTVFLLLALTFPWLAQAQPQSASDSSPIVIKFSHVVANDTPKGQGAKLFKHLAEQRLGDRVRVEIYPSSSLYNDGIGLNALITGDIQLMAPSVAKLGEYSEAIQVFDLPFLFDDMNAVTRFQQSSAGQDLLVSMTNLNILGLAYWHNGMRQMSANRPLVTPGMARGLKLRVEPSDVLSSEVTAVHALPRKMSFSEVYQGMQTGVVDGQSGNTYSNMATQNWQDVQRYVTETNSGVVSYMLITNAAFWRRLPADIRTTLEDVIDEVSKQVNADARRLNEKARQTIADSDAEVLTLTPEQRAAWQAAEAPVLRAYRDQIGADLIHTAQQANHP